MAIMELRQVRLTDQAVSPVLAGLTLEYESRYGPNSEMSRTGADEFEPPSGLFVVLLDGPTTTAGGGFRRHEEGVCEVKRMWTDPAYRRQGLAWRVLGALEEAALAAGYRRLILETGPRQPEAAAMYERKGYKRIPVFGIYPEARAYELDLTSPAPPGPSRQLPGQVD